MADEVNDVTISSVRARYLEKVSESEFQEKFFTTLVEQIHAEGGVAGQRAGASLVDILNAVNGSALGGVQSVQVGTGSKETGDVQVTLAKLGTAAITQSQVDAIATANSAAQAAQRRADDAYSLAQGRSRGTSYDDVAAMTATLKGAAQGQFQIGDTLYIKATNVPDYWISGTNDNNSGTYGYYSITPLETAKVDLSSYATVDALNGVKSTADSAKSTADSAKTTADSAKSTADSANVEIGKLKDGTTPAGKATKLATSRTISIAGDATGSATFDGSVDASITVALKGSGVAKGTYSAVAVNEKGLVTAGQQSIVFATSTDDPALENLVVGGIAIVNS